MAVMRTNQGDEFLVDDEDVVRISEFVWCVKNGYVTATVRKEKKSTTLYLHRFLMGLGVGDKRKVDHINHIRSDNRKENLRVCTNAQNMGNRGKNTSNKSGYKGVSWNAAGRVWVATIGVGGKDIWLGRFDDPKTAHEAYCEAAVKYHGEFAKFD